MDDFNKKYDHNLESQMYKKWLDAKSFSPKDTQLDLDSDNSFVISMPPPNVTGVLHLGHALMLSVEDVMVRYNRMKGKHTLWIPGTDHAGIATQVVVEKKIWKEDKLLRQNFGREKFVDKIWDWVKFSRSTIISQVKQMGSSCDWDREQFTLSEKLSRGVRKSFSNLYNENKIYKGTYIINWCPRCQTVLSDVEVTYSEENNKLYYIRYFIEGKGDSITVATVRPETMFGDVAIAVNPRDKRYKKFIGKHVLIPIVNKQIPVIADEGVDVMFGTGALKITPTHDPVDYEIGKKHGLPMDCYAIDKDGKLTDLAGEFAGKEVDTVFDNIIQYLTEIGNLESVEDYLTKIPHCERCNTRIQPLVSQQWFVDVKEAAEKAIDQVNNGQVQIIPERFNKTYFKWLEDIRPWCISRQLWWGHRIPVWTCKNGHQNTFDEDKILIDSQGQYSILSMIIFNLIADSRLHGVFSLDQLLNILFNTSMNPQEGKIYQVYLNIYKIKYKGNSSMLDEITQLEKVLNLFDSNKNSIEENGGIFLDILEKSKNIQKKGDAYNYLFKCKECGSLEMNQEEDVLDTWFSSALWPFSILGWPEQTPDFEKFYPNTVLETGYDILFFWVARMMMMGIDNTNTKPFEKVYLHGLVRDEKGEKMSKSLGNVIDPISIIEKYGADSLRLSLVTGSTPGNDVKFSLTKVDYNWRFINKLWNASRFIYMNSINGKSIKKLDYNKLRLDLEKNADKLNDFDKWMLNSVNALIVESEMYYDKFMLGEIAQNIIKTTWHNFCDWYIEITKVNKSVHTEKVLLYTLGTLLKMLHPYIPHVTEKLWEIMKFDGMLITSQYPTSLEIGEKSYKVGLFMDIVTELRNIRQSQDYKPHEQVSVIVSGNSSIIEFVKLYEDLLKRLVKAEKVEYISSGEMINNQYITSVIMDVIVGIKGEKIVNIDDQILQVNKKLSEHQQYLQNFRTLMSNSGFLAQAPKEVIDEKHKKMSEVKKSIVELEHELNRLKMLKK
ncbi:MAG: valine--tRNA ligase [Candidatus Absconditabacteria bacterium]